jgi:hypothetical protein
MRKAYPLRFLKIACAVEGFLVSFIGKLSAPFDNSVVEP